MTIQKQGLPFGRIPLTKVNGLSILISSTLYLKKFSQMIPFTVLPCLETFGTGVYCTAMPFSTSWIF